ncbi:MAG: hypothetical protein AAF721_14235 [Myxococcota bacterium]
MAHALTAAAPARLAPLRAADFTDDLPVVRRSELVAAQGWSRRWLSNVLWSALPFGIVAFGMWSDLTTVAVLALGMWGYIVAGEFVARGLERALLAYASGRFELAQRLLARVRGGPRRRAVQRYLVAAAHARGDLQSALEASDQLIEDIQRTSTATAVENWEARACRTWLLLEHGDIDLAERELAHLPSAPPSGRFAWTEIELALSIEYATDRIPSRSRVLRAEKTLAGVETRPDLARRLSLLIALLRWGWRRRGDDARARTWRGLMHSHGDRDRAVARLGAIGHRERGELAPYRR